MGRWYNPCEALKEEKLAKVVSFINYKGGVGKTTMAVEIAATLSVKYGFKVLVVDLDPQTNATFYLVTEEKWEEWTTTNGSLREVFRHAIAEEEFDAGRTIIEQAYGDLDLLPSHLDLLSVDLELAAKWGAQSTEAKLIIRDKLSPVLEARGYDFVIVDCPPNLNLVTQNGLMLSDSYVVVCVPEYFSVRGIGLIQTNIGNMMSQVNHNLTRFGAAPVPGPIMRGIIFNKIKYVSGATIDQQNWMQSVHRDYKDVTFDNFVSESVRVAEASYRGPISFSNRSPDQSYAGQLEAVGEEFFDRVVNLGD